MEEENLPIMNLPEESGEYKIVQFDGNNRPYLRFARESGRYDFHEFIVERFAQEIGVVCTQLRGSSDLVSALPDDAPYRLSGAGMCNVNLDERTAIFSGRSRDYRVGINQDHLDRLKAEFPELQISKTS